MLKIDPDRLFALNDLAWLLATAPEAGFRDGPEAVRLAERACRLSNYQATFCMWARWPPRMRGGGLFVLSL